MQGAVLCRCTNEHSLSEFKIWQAVLLRKDTRNRNVEVLQEDCKAPRGILVSTYSHVPWKRLTALQSPHL